MLASPRCRWSSQHPFLCLSTLPFPFFPLPDFFGAHARLHPSFWGDQQQSDLTHKLMLAQVCLVSGQPARRQLDLAPPLPSSAIVEELAALLHNLSAEHFLSRGQPTQPWKSCCRDAQEACTLFLVRKVTEAPGRAVMLAGPRLDFGEEATSEWLASYLSCLDQMDPDEEDGEAGESPNVVPGPRPAPKTCTSCIVDSQLASIVWGTHNGTLFSHNSPRPASSRWTLHTSS